MFVGKIMSDHNPTRPCRDNLYYCDDLKRRGDCRTNPYSTLKNCPKSCGICGKYETGDNLACLLLCGEKLVVTFNF